MTRDQEFSEIRRLLDHPKQQRPSADLIVGAQIRQEQFEQNQLAGTSRPWSVSAPLQLTVAADTPEYTLYSDDPTNANVVTDFGRSLFVYRELSNAIVGVPTTDYMNAFMNQAFEPIPVPLSMNSVTAGSGERLAFFRRAGSNAQMVRVFPTPTEAKTYKIVYGAGPIDWSTFEWSDTPKLPEWSHRRCMRVALSLLPVTEWNGLERPVNERKAARIGAALKDELAEQDSEYRLFLNNPDGGPTIDTIDAFYD